MAVTLATQRSEWLGGELRAAVVQRQLTKGPTTRKILISFSSSSSSSSSSAFGFEDENEYDDENDCQREVLCVTKAQTSDLLMQCSAVVW